MLTHPAGTASLSRQPLKPPQNEATIFCISEHSPLGHLLLGATQNALCFLQFGPSRTHLFTSLQNRYPQAQLITVSQHADTTSHFNTAEPLQDWLNAISEFLAGKNHPLDFPLTLQGTEFQRKVWSYLQQIPYGQVRSYRDVARGIGQPGAVRAVASACAANPVALVIPCHRVIRSNGEPGGYRWGGDLKQALLDLEQQQLEQKQII